MCCILMTSLYSFYRSLSPSLPLIVGDYMTPSLKTYMALRFPAKNSPSMVLQREIISNLYTRVVPCKTHIMCSHWVCMCPVGLTHSVSLRSDSSPPFLQVPLGALDLERHLEWTITSSSKRPSWRWIKRESSWRSGQIRGVSMEPQNPQQTLRPSVAPPPG